MGQSNDTPANAKPEAGARRSAGKPPAEPSRPPTPNRGPSAPPPTRAPSNGTPAPRPPTIRSSVTPAAERRGSPASAKSAPHGEATPRKPAKSDAPAAKPKEPEDDRILVFSTQRPTPAPPSPPVPPEPDRAPEAEEKLAPIRLARGTRPVPISRPPATSRPGEIVSLGESLRDFVAILEERRNRRLAEGHPAEAPVVLRRDDGDVCPQCHGAGYVSYDVPLGDPRFGQPMPCECKVREFEERRRREEEERLSKLDRYFSLDPFKDKTFETFTARPRGIEEARKAAVRFAQEPIGWLLLVGPPGTGKTHLAAAIAHERLAASSSVYFAVVPGLLDHLRAAFAPTSELTYDEMFETICSVELLVLDDLGAHYSTPWAADKLFQIINHRYNFQLLTVITTNEKLHGQLDDRVRSRLSDIALVRRVELMNEDHRPRNTKKGPRW